ncbi:rRNA-binding ribosome biosynthesis protein utp25 [Zalaria obscura]|uniref:rRNA-binding ribosome biosynthesis protein utp25 n=1 Tax=Zalaria obscura TaxID=2024903 RepID=A0ACC3SIH6_9PEZI
MAPAPRGGRFRGQGGRGRGGGRGGFRGRGGRGRGRGGGGYGREAFQSSRTADNPEEANLGDAPSEDEREEESPEVSEDQASLESEDEGVVVPSVKAYSALLQSFQQPSDPDKRPNKRRKMVQEEVVREDGEDESGSDGEADGAPGSDLDMEDGEQEVEQEEDQEEAVPEEDLDDDEDATDPFELHFANPDDNELSRRLTAVAAGQWQSEKSRVSDAGSLTLTSPAGSEKPVPKRPVKTAKQLKLKKRLEEPAHKLWETISDVGQAVAPYIYNNQDLMYGARTVENASELRSMAALHALNHIFKGRDKVLKNNARLSHADGDADLELRDQGFTRPKVLILLETRQACSKYVDALMDLCEPEQQENKKRFQDQFVQPEDNFGEGKPEDFRELFEGNDDNDFRLGMKFTRKTVKYFSPFYTSDIILASPLGLRRIIEHEDPKKADSDFLSSIELAIVDQADAMLMQNWEHVEFVFSHLNRQPKDAHGCDFSRVRNWYLDDKARYLRQIVVFSAYVTPELNRLYNSSMQNVSGKARFVPDYEGAILDIGLSIKQTFSRYDSPSPISDPDARFKYFTSAVIPSLLRYPKPAEGGHGILVFIPSYLDFVRVRNYFANSTATQNIAFGAISEYTELSDSRRARSHFFTGRHAVMLYTGRAHHFHRYRIRGVKKVVMYALPENPRFYQEIVGGFLGQTIGEGKIDVSETGVRAVFSKWDGLRLERIVGSKRVGGMIREKAGDTFDFI